MIEDYYFYNLLTGSECAFYVILDVPLMALDLHKLFLA